MVKKDVKLKEKINLVEKIEATQTLADAYFGVDDNGNVTYTPYMVEPAKIICFALYFLDGVTFEKSGDADSNGTVYDEVINDDELMELYKTLSDINEESEVSSQFSDIVWDAESMADFRKEEILADKRSEPVNRVMEMIDVIVSSIGNFSKLNIQDISGDDLKNMLGIAQKFADSDFNADVMTDIIRNATSFDMDEATKEIIDHKNAEIEEFKKYKLLWDARNVAKQQER